jgi:ribosome-associated translation inhibitor RaiA
VARARGNGGEYFYFFCPRRRDGCTSRYISVDLIDEAVTAHYRTLRLTPEFRSEVLGHVAETESDGRSASEALRRQLQQQLQALDRREDNLLDLAAEMTIPKDKLRERLAAVHDQREQIETQLSALGVSLQAGAQNLRQAVDLLEHPDQIYAAVDSQSRRLMNQAFFEKLYVKLVEPDEAAVTGHALRKPFRGIVEAQDHFLGQAEGEARSPEGRLLASVVCGDGSN